MPYLHGRMDKDMEGETMTEDEILLEYLLSKYSHMPLKTIHDFEVWNPWEMKRLRTLIEKAYDLGIDTYIESNCG